MYNRAIDLLYQARQNEIEIALNEDELHLRLPRDKSFDKDLIEQIKINKQLIVDFIKSSKRSANGYSAIKKFNRTSTPYIPLSFSQERLFFIDQLEGSVQYHMPVALRLQGKLDTDALVNALQTIVHRHEVLRTVIRKQEGQGYQLITDKKLHVDIVDGSIYHRDIKLLELYIQGLIQAPFDLSDDHMIRAALIKLTEEDHVLVVTTHHIASDGWSVSIIVKELVELYAAYVEGRPVRLAEPEIQYADYAIWQLDQLSGPVLDKRMDYWKKKLEDVAQLQLPVDYPRPAVQSIKGAVTSFRLDKRLVEQLHALSQQQGTTLFMTLLAVFKVLLYRYSGQEDICVGSPTANRTSKEVEGLIGFFVNTLALRSEVNGTASFAELLQQVKTTTLEAYQHQDVPFEKVVETVVRERDISRSPLFQVMFILQNTPDVPELLLGNVHLSRQSFDHHTSKFDLTFSLSENALGIHIAIEYCTGLYAEETIARMAGHYSELLQSVVSAPGQQVNLLPMVTNDERRQLLIEFNDTQADYPKNKTVVHLFEEQVLKNPGAIAVLFEQQQLTYKELNERANQLADYLKSKGVTEETLVPICIDRGPDMIVGILGILKAGGAYVPIDPEYPLERIHYILKDIGAGLIVSSGECRTKLSGAENAVVIALDTDWITIEKHPAENVPVAVKPGNLVYVMYTSGSTGKPKGVMIEHRSVINVLTSISAATGFNDSCSMLSVTTYSFDICYLEFYMPLINGGKLMIVSRDTAMDGFRLAESITSYSPTHMQATPATWQLLLDSGWQNKQHSKVLIGGESVSEAIKENLTAIADVWNVYGPTETTIWSSIKKLEAGQKVTIGKPVANTGMHILNKGQMLCPVGIAGEIYITGDGLARGYVNRDALTMEKFIHDPFSKIPGARMYRTGDLGKWLPDGNMECLGRIDDQVKIRGYRIELGEIESVLQQSELINQSVVLAKQDKQGLKSLISYYVPNIKIVKQKETTLFEEQVENWKEIYEAEYTYTGGDKQDEEFDIGIWNDSFTGHAIPQEQMAEWVGDIVKVIHPEQAGEVLEIGCGTGLIYYRLAGKVEKYTGTDFSRSSIRQIRNRISKGLRDYGPTELQVCAAHEVSLHHTQLVDTIILNSVVQYFPGEGYMDTMIGNCLALLKSSGRIIIGDVRDLRLLPLFKSRLQLQKLKPKVSIKDFKWAVEQEVLKEEELCFSPAYFYRLASRYPQITHVDIQWKQCTSINELTLYRYTVVLYAGIEKEKITPPWQHWTSISDKQSILNLLQPDNPIVALKNVPNPRLRYEQFLTTALSPDAALSTVGDVLEAFSKGMAEDKERTAVEHMLKTAYSKGYRCHLLLNKDPFLVDVVIERGDSGNFIAQDDYDAHNRHSNKEAYTNVPLFDSISVLIQKDIRALLQKKLPEYMIPSEFVALANLPLTSNGKTDRLFLSRREEKRTSGQLSYVPAATELQQKLAVIWQELLGIERIGIHDNFFELGGHSLLAMKMVAHMKKSLLISIPIQVLFQFSTINNLSNYLDWESEVANEQDDPTAEIINI